MHLHIRATLQESIDELAAQLRLQNQRRMRGSGTGARGGWQVRLAKAKACTSSCINACVLVFMHACMRACVCVCASGAVP
jgi:hypothetical protein